MFLDAVTGQEELGSQLPLKEVPLIARYEKISEMLTQISRLIICMIWLVSDTYVINYT